MRTNIDIDDALMSEAQKASGQRTKKQTIEEALRLLIRLRRQQEVDAAFGKYGWRGNSGPEPHEPLIIAWCIAYRAPLLHNDRDFEPMARHFGLIEVPITT